MEHWLDLHMHSNYSNDGEFSPAVLVEKCAAAGLKTIALTDHNSTSGIKEAAAHAKKYNLTFIPGIELDCQHNGKNLHLLGYGIDFSDPCYARITENVNQMYRSISKERVQRARELGFVIREEKIAQLSVRGGIVMSTMIAEAVLTEPANDGHPALLPYRAGGERSANPCVNFAWDYCVQGKAAYVPISFMPLQEAISVIHQTGGAAVWAHPGANIGCNGELAEEICQAGIDGIEIISNYHDDATRRFYQEKAAAHHLLYTIGSDFHGKAKPSVHLGQISTENEANLLKKLLSAIQKYQSL